MNAVGRLISRGVGTGITELDREPVHPWNQPSANVHTFVRLLKGTYDHQS